jgi:hypothetical protein
MDCVVVDVVGFMFLPRDSFFFQSFLSVFFRCSFLPILFSRFISVARDFYHALMSVVLVSMWVVVSECYLHTNELLRFIRYQVRRMMAARPEKTTRTIDNAVSVHPILSTSTSVSDSIMESAADKKESVDGELNVDAEDANVSDFQSFENDEDSRFAAWSEQGTILIGKKKTNHANDGDDDNDDDDDVSAVDGDNRSNDNNDDDEDEEGENNDDDDQDQLMNDKAETDLDDADESDLSSMESRVRLLGRRREDVADVEELDI